MRKRNKQQTSVSSTPCLLFGASAWWRAAASPSPPSPPRAAVAWAPGAVGWAQPPWPPLPVPAPDAWRSARSRARRAGDRPSRDTRCTGSERQRDCVFRRPGTGGRTVLMQRCTSAGDALGVRSRNALNFDVSTPPPGSLHGTSVTPATQPKGVRRSLSSSAVTPAATLPTNRRTGRRGGSDSSPLIAVEGGGGRSAVRLDCCTVRASNFPAPLSSFHPVPSPKCSPLSPCSAPPPLCAPRRRAGPPLLACRLLPPRRGPCGCPAAPRPLTWTAGARPVSSWGLGGCTPPSGPAS